MRYNRHKFKGRYTKMMSCKTFANQSSFCGGSAFAASFDARIHSLLDTAVYLVVSICVLLLDVRVILPSA